MTAWSGEGEGGLGGAVARGGKVGKGEGLPRAIERVCAKELEGAVEGEGIGEAAGGGGEGNLEGEGVNAKGEVGDFKGALRGEGGACFGGREGGDET